ncbi:MAG: carbohydrate ABC transporter permease [Rhodobacteraceae bacterium]|nr:carbohydrate ABC transporter permease [Paracoccaceae bacterium]
MSAQQTSLVGMKRPSRRALRNRIKKTVPWMIISAFLVFALFPVYWIILIAFRPRGDIFQYPAALLPTNMSLDNIRYVWFGSETNDPVIGFLGTSLVISVTASVIAIAFGVCCAYALGRFRIGGNFLSVWILSQRFLPPIALVVPLYLMFRELGLLDTYLGLIILYATFTIPIVVWLMLGYVESAPRELEEAAYVDGAGYWTTFVRVALPVLKPGLSVAAVFTFIFIWNEYVLAYQLAGDDVATITVYLPRLRSAIAELYGEIAAASLLSVLPAILFAGMMQRFLVRGLAFGGLK